ncbi:hypothetical protein TNCT_79611 [Trichonephila clavata]|uniref:Uncharacterized protein n=1 Tax=Trichonephila clavata TaxID=2740835 RepID=A0A8X6KK73_TRICU|nr:hypothetical protein TNCT_79611 [Trichonephila clavata]
MPLKFYLMPQISVIGEGMNIAVSGYCNEVNASYWEIPAEACNKHPRNMTPIHVHLFQHISLHRVSRRESFLDDVGILYQFQSLFKETLL